MKTYSTTSVKSSGCFFPQITRLATVTELTDQIIPHIQVSGLSRCQIELTVLLFDSMLYTRIWIE